MLQNCYVGIQGCKKQIEIGKRQKAGNAQMNLRVKRVD